MADTERRSLVALSDANLTIEDDDIDIRGRTVLDGNGDEIGEVDDLLYDQHEDKVRFLEVGAGGFLGIGEDKVLIPVDAITGIDQDNVHVDKLREFVAGAPRYDPDVEADDDYYGDLYGYYGYAPYWVPGYTYPPYPYYL